ncbi:caffeic acid [Musa troglodytarum]|uniref:Caffeic acid n=1 Tax=Musa troglodytarum TaxID=320322 RepID=A0A9E7F7K6_9LILI|nr:caffeic acid [Musa troglodytarum]
MPATNDVFTLTAEEEEEACTRALQLSCGAVLPMVLKVAIELGLLQIIVKAGPATPLSSEEIAAQLPSEHPESAAAWVDRILRLLAANKIVGCIVEAGADDRRSRKYCKAPICKYLTENEDGSLANLLLMHHDNVFLDLCNSVDTPGRLLFLLLWQDILSLLCLLLRCLLSIQASTK